MRPPLILAINSPGSQFAHTQAKRMWLSGPTLLMSLGLSFIVSRPYGESWKGLERDLVYFEYDSEDMDNSVLSGWVNPEDCERVSNSLQSILTFSCYIFQNRGDWRRQRRV